MTDIEGMASAVQPNAELAYRVLDQIDAHPESWNQGAWLRKSECGTAACFAGWAVILAGHRVEFETEADPAGHTYFAAIDGDGDALISEIASLDLGIDNLRVRCRLCDACGVTERVSLALFNGGNDRELLGQLVAEIFGPRPVATS